MDDQLKPILTGIARHALTTAGGVLVTHGYMQSSQTEQFVAGGMVLAGVIWSWWQKQGQADALALWKKIAVRAAQSPAQPSASAASLLSQEKRG